MTAPDWGVSDRGPLNPLIVPFNPVTASGSGDQIKAGFAGTDRKAAKTSVVSGEMEPETTIDRLASSLVDDTTMRAHDPTITEDASSDRVDEEKRSVKVDGWIYAIKYEDDQDWHLIVGTDPSAGQRTYFNCEVSGLPSHSADSFDTLLKARQSLAAILDDDLPGPGSYTKYNPPIPVRIEGSLFFDVDHAAGVVGPAGMRPKTAWEIHPITKIELAQ